MARYKNSAVSRILPIVFIAIIVILAVTALVSVAQTLFGGSRSGSEAEVDRAQAALVSTDADSRVRMVVRGPIVADEEFNSYQVDITPSSRTLTTYQGYLERVVERERLGNNTAAYEEFVFALDRAQFSEGRTLSEEADDTRGICATGRVYEFFIIDGDEEVQRLWTTSCRNVGGSLRANVDIVTRLFTDQIPDARALTRAVNL